MGGVYKTKKIKRSGFSFLIEYTAGWPMCQTAAFINVNADRIVQANIEPIKIESQGSNGRNKIINKAFYDNEPAIIVFHTLFGKGFNSKLKLFNEQFKDSLNCNYVVGRFNEVSYPSDVEKKACLERGKAFGLALFGKSQNEVIDITINFTIASGCRGAFIKGKIFDADLVYVWREKYLSD